MSSASQSPGATHQVKYCTTPTLRVAVVSLAAGGRQLIPVSMPGVCVRGASWGGASRERHHSCRIRSRAWRRLAAPAHLLLPQRVPLGGEHIYCAAIRCAILLRLVPLGGYGGKLVKDVIGVYVEEFYPLRPEQTLKLSNGYEITLWSELSRLNGAEMVASFQGSDVDGSVAIAKRNLGTSTAWYQGTELTLDSQKKFFSSIASDLGIKAEGGVDTEVVHRGPYRFEINHGKNSVAVSKN